MLENRIDKYLNEKKEKSFNKSFVKWLDHRMKDINTACSDIDRSSKELDGETVMYKLEFIQDYIKTVIMPAMKPLNLTKK